MKTELLIQILDALEKTKTYSKIYEVILKQTGDRKQARDAVAYLARIEEENEVMPEGKVAS